MISKMKNSITCVSSLPSSSPVTHTHLVTVFGSERIRAHLITRAHRHRVDALHRSGLDGLHGHLETQLR